MIVMEIAPRRPSGRPRSFDREVALEAAMRLFWKYGYEGVSFQQLTAVLGIGAPSLYAAFGNKKALYREALDRYVDMRGASDLSFMEDARSPREAVCLLLDGTARGLVDPAGEVGCMLNTGMIASHPDHEDLARDLAQRRAQFRALLIDTLQRWMSRERATRLSFYVTAVMQGMAIQARDGFRQAQLQAVVDEALKAIPDDSYTRTDVR
ncbi:TetR/AcrR family transcriptional regulator [Gluconobacter wancherniae]|uniref:TetR/AcrR family transcriptional regulator n=1 Tax=Gluconobacter wancherniae TaxID=1307955 RepID=UPI001B8D330D|nr:TetR/AcrR family transcriptional regulator [Gluconobacter wancherniae]MBS1063846.1 TetR/AcrR family transcriptional regulator [Gluconobacter wancherniae]